MIPFSLYRIVRKDGDEWVPVRDPKNKNTGGTYTMEQYAQESLARIREQGRTYKIQVTNSGFPWKDVR